MDSIQDGLLAILGVLVPVIMFGLYCLWQNSRGRSVRGGWLFEGRGNGTSTSSPDADDLQDYSLLRVNTDGTPFLPGFDVLPTGSGEDLASGSEAFIGIYFCNDIEGFSHDEVILWYSLGRILGQ